jgi:hypothetical protein
MQEPMARQYELKTKAEFVVSRMAPVNQRSQRLSEQNDCGCAGNQFLDGLHAPETHLRQTQCRFPRGHGGAADGGWFE